MLVFIKGAPSSRGGSRGSSYNRVSSTFKPSNITTTTTTTRTTGSNITTTTTSTLQQQQQQQQLRYFSLWNQITTPTTPTTTRHRTTPTPTTTLFTSSSSSTLTSSSWVTTMQAKIAYFSSSGESSDSPTAAAATATEQPQVTATAAATATEQPQATATATADDTEPLKKGRRKKVLAPPKSGEDGTPFVTEEGTPFIVDDAAETPFDPNRELTPLEQLRDLLRRKKWEDVENLLLSQAEKGQPFAKQDYHYLFEHFGKTEKKIESFHNFLDQMAKYSIGGGPDTTTYYVLMVALAKRGSTDDVMWAFLDMLHRKIKANDQILHFVVPKVFNKIAPYKKKKTGEGVVDTAGEAQADAAFRRFLVFLRDLGIWPDPFVYQLIIKQCEVMGYPRTMLKYHDEMKMAEKLKVQLQQKEKAQQNQPPTQPPVSTATQP